MVRMEFEDWARYYPEAARAFQERAYRMSREFEGKVVRFVPRSEYGREGYEVFEDWNKVTSAVAGLFAWDARKRSFVEERWD